MLAAAVLSLAAVAGCRTHSGKSTVVELWALGREGEVVQRLATAFESLHPGLRVRVQQIPWSAAHEKLLTAYVGGAMPDLFQAGNTWLPELAALDAVEPLDRRIAASSAVDRADYFPGILDTNVVAGVTYGVPWYVDTRLLFYRTDLLRQAGYTEPPRSWDGWREAMSRIEQKVGPKRYAILLPLREWQTPVILALQLGADLLRDGDQYGDFRSPAFRRAFDFYLDLFHCGLAPSASSTQVTNVYQDFAAGFFSMYITGPWNIGEFEQRLPESLHGRWATAPMPGPGDQYPGISLAGGASLAIYRGSKRKDAAWKLIEYLSEPAQQEEFYRLTGDLPSRRKAWEERGLAHDRYAAAFWEQLQHVRSTPKIPEWERIADDISQYTEAAIRGDMSADEALTALDTHVDAILEKRRWLERKKASP